jgi:hypothetical protein
MRAATEVKPASSKRSIILSVVFLVLVAVVVWAFDGVLFFKLRMFANEAYADRNYPMLTIDAVNELRGYSPKRLSRFLSFPSTKIRAIACMAIGARHELRDPFEWVGVAPALLKAHRDTDDHYVRLRIASSLELMPIYPDEDREFVFKFSQELLAADGGDSTAVVAAMSTIAVVDPSQRQRCLSALAAWLPKESDHERKELLKRIVHIDPGSAEAADAVRWACRDVPYYHFPNFKSVFEKHPSLFDDLLKGTRSQRFSAFLLSYSFFGVNVPGGGGGWGLIDLAKVSSSQRELVKRTALEHLERDPDMTATECIAVFGCLRQFPEGPKTLLEHAKHTKGTRRAYALSAGTAGVRDLKLGEALLLPYVTDALSWLNDDDRDVHQAVFALIHDYPGDPSWFKSQKMSVDAPIVEACRRFLDKHPGRHDFSCLTILANATPEIDPRDVERIAKPLQAALLGMKTNFERTRYRPQGYIDALHETLFARLKKHADRPVARKVLDLRQQLLDEGIVTKPRKR